LAADGVPEADRAIVFEADMRFAGQRWEIAITLPAQPKMGDGGREAEAIFREEYLRRYGAAATTTSGIVELVAIRAIGIGRMATEEEMLAQVAVRPLQVARSVATRLVRIERAQPPILVNTFDGASLAPCESLLGPALIDGSDTTLWIPRGMSARMDAHRTLAIEVDR
jgi:N-methylhydantoinase A